MRDPLPHCYIALGEADPSTHLGQTRLSSLLYKNMYTLSYIKTCILSTPPLVATTLCYRAMLTFHPRNRTLAFKQKCLFTAVLFASILTFAADSPDGPKGAVVLIIRHAEDGGTCHDLAPRGHERAEA